jgi:hypothetical protein
MFRLSFLLTGCAVFATSALGQQSLVPFPVDWTHAHESAIDLSRFLDAPAGRDGFLAMREGKIVTPGGKRFRGWGVNLAIDSCFPDKEEASEIAADLARLGVNVVRFHHTDTDWGRSLIDGRRGDTQQVDADNLDRFDFIFAELKRRGIYSVLTLNVHRKFKEGDNVRDGKILAIGKGATYFNLRLIELQHAFARQLLTHRNPYTDTEYRAEPAIAAIEMLNENSLVEAWCSSRLRRGVMEKTDDTWQPIPDSYAAELDALYNDWLKKNRPLEQIAAWRKEAGVGENNLVPRLVPKEFTQASRERFQAEGAFYMSVEADFYRSYLRLLREELGVKALLIGSNDHNDSISGYAHIHSNLIFDIVDGHGYWEHPTIGKETRAKNNPMVNDPLDSTVTQFARTPVRGRPFTIGETNHPWPHKFAVEGFPILSAYALFHDWDGIYWFDWEKGRLAKPEDGLRKNGWFDVSNDPVKLANLTACALMWHRGDVAPAKETHLRRYTIEQAIDTLRRFGERPYFTPGFDLTTPLRHATRFTFDEDATPSPLDADGKSPKLPWDLAPGEIVSDTGELAWRDADRKQGLVVIDTPRTQAVIGFVRTRWWESGRSTKHLMADPQNEHGTILLQSLDDSPIASAKRLLLTATARAVNTGTTWKDDWQTLAEWGQGPVLIDPLRATLTLRRLTETRSIRVTPLSSSGKPTGKSIEAEKSGADWKLKIGEPAATQWLVEIDR